MAAFHVHRSNRLERLSAALCDLLAKPAGTPFKPDMIVAQGRGMGSWIGGELAKQFGVWAAPIVYPRAFVEELLLTVLGKERSAGPALSEDLLRWAVQAALPALCAKPEFSTFSSYLEGDSRGVRLAELSERIASIFDQYLTYRPDWIQMWDAGDISLVPASEQWQPLLWQHIQARLQRPHLAQGIDQLAALLSSKAVPQGLPPRVLLFGLSTLPPLYMRALALLSRHTPVHCFLFSPAPQFVSSWQSDAEKPCSKGSANANALLSSLGFLGAEFEGVLSQAVIEASAQRIDHDLFEKPALRSVLGGLQADLYAMAADSAPKFEVEAQPAAASEADGLFAEDVLSERRLGPAITVHSCHGPMREVEVLHDQILELVSRNENRLAPEEVLVLVPDLPTYAPLIEAVFARERGERDFIPFHVADLSERQGAQVFEALLRVMILVRGRVTASQVLDLLTLEPVARRFGIDDASLETLRTWVSESGVRWGMDAQHRSALGLPNQGSNTWHFGLQRLLLGYAMPNSGPIPGPTAGSTAGSIAGAQLFEGVLGYDEIEGTAAELLGNLAGFTRVLFGWLRELQTPRPLSAWGSAIARLASELFAESADNSSQMMRIGSLLEAAIKDATVAGFEGAVDVQILQSMLERELESAGADRGFFSGGVTFCAMVPMRSIPFRAICMLGLNDGSFPRSHRLVELDLIHNGKLDRRAGDRSRRDDDRYLFLETLFAARERLIITYSGQSVRDDKRRPPSVCVSELLGYLESRAERGTQVRAQVFLQHRLQGFSPDYFSKVPSARLFSYAQSFATAANCVRGARQQSSQFMQGELPAPEIQEIQLAKSIQFFQSPPAFFLTERLGLYLKQENEPLTDREPLALDNWDAWQLGDRLLRHLFAQGTVKQAESLLRAEGLLPMGHTGTFKLEEIFPACEDIVEQARAAQAGALLPPLPLQVKLKGGTVTGIIDNRYPGAVVKAGYSKLSQKRELAAWVAHVALCAVPGAGARSVLIGRNKNAAAVLEFKAMPEPKATAILTQLVQLYAQGQKCPLPFLPATSAAYFAKHSEARKALANAISTYSGSDNCELATDPHAARVFGKATPPFDQEYEAGGRALEQTEFHRIALAVYGPLQQERE